MALDGCGLVCKYILIIFNCIFAVVGFVFLGLGLWLRFSDNTRPIFQIQELNSSTFVLGVTVMIGLGFVMLIVVMFGDHGACSERKCSLQVFSVLVAILAGAEIIIGVLVYSRSGQVGERIAEFYVSLYGVYVATGDPAIAVTLTFVHKMLHCCGLTGIPLIDIAKQTCPAPDGFLQNFVMPNCPVTIATVFDSKAPLVMGLFVGTGALLLIALICSTTLAKKIHVSASSPQYIILTPPNPSLANPQPPQQVFANSYPYPDPVVFSPLTMANIPVAQA